MTLKRQLTVGLSHFQCSIAQTGTYNWSFILYTDNEFVQLDGIRNADGTNGNPVPVPVDPGPPAAGNHAQTEMWKYNKGLYDDHELVQSITRETMIWAFHNGDIFLDLKDQTGHLFQTPLFLFDFTWRVYATNDQRDAELDRADADLLTSFDPADPPTTYFAVLQDARYRFRQLNSPQSATDAVLIRKALAEFKKHANLSSSWRKWQKKATERANMPAPQLPPHTWQEFKTFFLTEFQQIKGLADSTGNNLANAVKAELAPLREENEALANATLAQQTALDDLREQVAALTNQANAAASPAPAPAPAPPASPAPPQNINEFFEQLLQQRGVGGGRGRGRGRGNGRGNGRARRNDLGDGQRSVRRYDNNNYCWTHGFDIAPSHTSDNCPAPADGHCRQATIEDRRGGSTRNVFHYFMNQS